MVFQVGWIRTRSCRRLLLSWRLPKEEMMRRSMMPNWKLLSVQQVCSIKFGEVLEFSWLVAEYMGGGGTQQALMKWKFNILDLRMVRHG
jgi:hypothetical protein